MHRLKHYLRILAMPLILLVVFVSLSLVWQVFNLPPAEELKDIVQVWFDTYGLPAVFLASIIEGGLLVGSYFPGVFVIFLGVVIAETVPQVVAVVVVATLGLLLAHNFNYFLGRYGWHTLLLKFGMKGAVDDAKLKLERKGPVAILMTYWLPSLGALTDTAAGIIRLPYKTFVTYSVISSVLWNTLVAFGVYFFGDLALEAASPSGDRSLVVYGVIGLWMAIILIIDYVQKSSHKAKDESSI